MVMMDKMGKMDKMDHQDLKGTKEKWVSLELMVVMDSEDLKETEVTTESLRFLRNVTVCL